MHVATCAEGEDSKVEERWRVKRARQQQRKREERRSGGMRSRGRRRREMAEEIRDSEGGGEKERTGREEGMRGGEGRGTTCRG